MNLCRVLNEEHYQTTIYLNDRPYEVLDIGEGDCLIVIVNSISDFIEQGSLQSHSRRFVIVDISKVVTDSLYNVETVEQFLVSDLHLLLDVFWLSDVEIKSKVGCICMDSIDHMLKVRSYSRAQMK